jgi:hypothetical protein
MIRKQVLETSERMTGMMGCKRGIAMQSEFYDAD